MRRYLGGILVGGQARRLGGQPKGLITVDQSSLINRSIEALTPYCDDIVLLGSAVDYAHLNLSALPDVYPDSGPLSGLAAALDATNHEVLVVPCDLPYIDASVFSKLVQAPSGHPLGCKGPKRTHPLIARYPKSAAPMIHKFAQMQGSVHDAFEACNGRWIKFESERPFTNVNTPEEVAQLA